MRRPFALSAVAVVAVAAVLVGTVAFGDAKGDRALSEAVAKGKELWQKPFGSGKACLGCHVGPNKMTGARIKSYPKYDKSLDKVVSGQQKINQMIAGQAKGTALELGSDDLNSLEAYMASLK